MQVAAKCSRVAPDIDGAAEFGLGLADWFAGFDTVEIGEFVGARCDEIGGLEDDIRTLRAGHARPRPIVERVARGSNRALGIGFGSCLVA